jgi:ABC-2 type transport system ATP-binding protein
MDNMPGIRKVQQLNGILQLNCDDTITTTQINEYCISKGVTLSHLLLKKKSLETKFIELTNK